MSSETIYPVTDAGLRRALAYRDICPDCGSELDTGWECNNRECQHDAMTEAREATNKDVLALLLHERQDEIAAVVRC